MSLKTNDIKKQVRFYRRLGVGVVVTVPSLAFDSWSLTGSASSTTETVVDSRTVPVGRTGFVTDVSVSATGANDGLFKLKIDGVIKWELRLKGGSGIAESFDTEFKVLSGQLIELTVTVSLAGEIGQFNASGYDI